jgi:hypothetical protein
MTQAGAENIFQLKGVSLGCFETLAQIAGFRPRARQ